MKKPKEITVKVGPLTVAITTTGARVEGDGEAIAQYEATTKRPRYPLNPSDLSDREKWLPQNFYDLMQRAFRGEFGEGEGQYVGAARFDVNDALRKTGYRAYDWEAEYIIKDPKEIPSLLVAVHSTDEEGKYTTGLIGYVVVEPSDFRNERGLRFDGSLYDHFVAKDSFEEKAKAAGIESLGWTTWNFVDLDQLREKKKEAEMFLIAAKNTIKNVERAEAALKAAQAAQARKELAAGEEVMKKYMDEEVEGYFLLNDLYDVDDPRRYMAYSPTSDDGFEELAAEAENPSQVYGYTRRLYGYLAVESTRYYVDEDTENE